MSGYNNFQNMNRSINDLGQNHNKTLHLWGGRCPTWHPAKSGARQPPARGRTNGATVPGRTSDDAPQASCVLLRAWLPAW